MTVSNNKMNAVATLAAGDPELRGEGVDAREDHGSHRVLGEVQGMD